MAKPAVADQYLVHSGYRLSGHLPPVTLLALSASGGDVLVCGSPHKSAGDEATSRPDARVSNVM